jgi:uncharacterized oligopeptide transporter (OPT) family protein
LLVAGSFLPLLFSSGAIIRSFRQLAQLRGRPPAGGATDDASLAPRLWAPLLAVSVGVILLLGWWAFDISPLITLLSLVLSLVLANVSARATGETDLSPGGSVGTISLIAFGGRGPVSGVMGGSVAMAVTSQTSQMLWAFRAGRHLGASPRAQIGAQILGVLVGAIVTVPVYLVIVSSYGLGTETMPATSALSWKATIEMMRGLTALPHLGGTAAVIGLAAGVLLMLLGRLPLGRYLPTAAAIGVGFMLPFSLSATAVAGALLAFGAQRLLRGADEQSILAIAAGGMAGESLMGVLIAILMATGVL